jgi:hypothetical protein
MMNIVGKMSQQTIVDVFKTSSTMKSKKGKNFVNFVAWEER